MLEVKVLGTGCANCQRLEASVRRVLQSQGLAAQIEKVTDLGEIMKYAILATPGLVIDGKLVAAGRVPSDKEIAGWLPRATPSA
jgi:small redox-active disulfide protein 2